MNKTNLSDDFRHPDAEQNPARNAAQRALRNIAAEDVHIVNGDLHMRQVVHDHVSSEGFNAVSFESVAQYRAASKSNAPACLILDVDLPDLNRFDLPQPVGNMFAPIVFVTTWRDVPPWVGAIKAGAVAFLTSPLRGSDLLSAVHTAIAMHRQARPHHTEMAQLQQCFSRLTPRERQVFGLVNSGLLNKQSALELGISEVTLQIHRRHVMKKMAARSLADLVRMATKLELPVPVRFRPARRIAEPANWPERPVFSASIRSRLESEIDEAMALSGR